MKLNRIVLCLAVLASFSFAQQTAKPDYKSLDATLAAGKTDIDYDLLRHSCAEDSKHCEEVDSEAKNAMLHELQAGDKSKALAMAEKILQKNRAYLWANMVAWSAANSLGLKGKAEYYDQIVRGLLGSIRHGGDGRTEENTWNAIEVTEEYATLAIMGYRPQGQADVVKNGHHFDVMKVTDGENKEPFDIYFNTDVIWNNYAKIFGKK